MKYSSKIYWGSTILAAGYFLINGAQQTMLNEHLIEEYSGSLMPEYMLQAMGVAKLLAAVALLIAPRLPRWLVEWSYAGLVFVLGGAAYSHVYLQYEMGHLGQISVLLILLAVSVMQFRKRV